MRTISMTQRLMRIRPAMIHQQQTMLKTLASLIQIQQQHLAANPVMPAANPITVTAHQKAVAHPPLVLVGRLTTAVRLEPTAEAHHPPIPVETVEVHHQAAAVGAAEVHPPLAAVVLPTTVQPIRGQPHARLQVQH